MDGRFPLIGKGDEVGVLTSSLVLFRTCYLLIHRQSAHSSYLAGGRRRDEARGMPCRDCLKSGTVVHCSRHSSSYDRCRNERSNLDKRAPIEAYYGQGLMPACCLKRLGRKFKERWEDFRKKEWLPYIAYWNGRLPLQRTLYLY